VYNEAVAASNADNLTDCVASVNAFDAVKLNIAAILAFNELVVVYNDAVAASNAPTLPLKDAYVSGTLYLNNLTVYGTQSVNYISSSQLNIATNIITVNTATPTVRFGGLAVYDSGSTGLTGSILWDSQDNQWIYSNPSGSAYDSAMFLVGPRSTGALGSEVGITTNALAKGDGFHHMTSSVIYDVSGSVGIGTSSPIVKLHVKGGADYNTVFASDSNRSGWGIAVPGTATAKASGLLLASDESFRFGTFSYYHIVMNQSGSTQIYNTASAAATTFAADGNVGIGTTSPAYKLTVYDTNSTVHFAISNPTAGSISQMGFIGDTKNAYIFKGNSTYSSYGGANSLNLYTDTSGGPISFHPGATNNAVTFNTSGNVGIGTTSTPAKLTISGDVKSTGYYNTFSASSAAGPNSRNSFQSYNSNETTLSQGWIAADFGDNSTTSNRVVIGSGYGNNAIIAVHNGALNGWGVLLMQPNGDATTFGTGSNMGYTVGVKGTFYASGTSTFAGSLSANIITANTFTDNYITMSAAQINRGGGFVELQYSSAGGVRIFGNTAYPIVFTSGSGNVGIGTATPISKFHVYGAGTTFATIEAGGGDYSYLRLMASGSGNGYIIKNIATGNSMLDKALYLWNDQGPIQFVPSQTVANAVTISTSGSLGIGTSTPTAKLHVSGADAIIRNAYIGDVATYGAENAQFSHISC